MQFSSSTIDDDVKPQISAGSGFKAHVMLRVSGDVHVSVEKDGEVMYLSHGDGKNPEEANKIIEVSIYSLKDIRKQPTYKVNVSHKIFTLKYQIFERERTELKDQCLSFNGKALDDLHSFADYNIRNGDAIVFSDISGDGSGY